MSRSLDDRKPLRLRVPASLAVAVLGASATVVMATHGCTEHSTPDPVDAGMIEKRGDGGVDGAAGQDGELADASIDNPDAAVVPADAPIDARPDAAPT